jgi:hypothetical protein
MSRWDRTDCRVVRAINVKLERFEVNLEACTMRADQVEPRERGRWLAQARYWQERIDGLKGG